MIYLSLSLKLLVFSSLDYNSIKQMVIRKKIEVVTTQSGSEMNKVFFTYNIVRIFWLKTAAHFIFICRSPCNIINLKPLPSVFIMIHKTYFSLCDDILIVHNTLRFRLKQQNDFCHAPGKTIARLNRYQGIASWRTFYRLIIIWKTRIIVPWFSVLPALSLK